MSDAGQIGQQLPVFADRRIDAAADSAAVKNLCVQRFAHSMDALKFEIPVVTGQFEDCRNRVRVVAGKLRIDAVSHAEQLLRTAQIRDVGC